MYVKYECNGGHICRNPECHHARRHDAHLVPQIEDEPDSMVDCDTLRDCPYCKDKVKCREIVDYV